MIIISEYAAKNAKDISPELQSLVQPWLAFCQKTRLRRESLYVDYKRTKVDKGVLRNRSRPFIILTADSLEYIASAKTLKKAVELAEESLARRGC